MERRKGRSLPEYQRKRFCSKKCADQAKTRPLPTRKCVTCQSEFAPRDRDLRRKFCSYACARNQIVTCKHCGAEAPKARMNARFCSRKCKNAARAQRRLRESVCRQCGRAFCSIDAKFCSLKCWYEFAKTHSARAARKCKVCGGPLRKDRSIQTCSYECFRKLRAVTAHCEHCGTEFRRPRSTRGTMRFCSITCRNKAKSMIKRGPQNQLWRGHRKDDRGVTWKEARNETRDRDGHACQAPGCGKPEPRGQMPVDHIVPFALAKSLIGVHPGYDPNNAANLICLCPSHHATKTSIELRLLRGDIVGFVSEVKRIIPWPRLVQAMQYSHLPVPQGIAA